MSFGWSITDILTLGQVAFKVVQGSRKACGEYDELTREVTALHAVLQRLETEFLKSNSAINREDDSNGKELRAIAMGCRKVLRVLDIILDKYNALDEEERRGRKLWQKIKFGNGEMNDLGDIRSKVIFHTSAMTFYLNLVNAGTLGRMEEQMNLTGGVVKEIQVAVNEITIQSISKNSHEGSILTTYSNDDKSVWRQFRRELIQSGFSSSDLQKNKNLIQGYVKELGSRGILDEHITESSGFRGEIEKNSEKTTTPTPDLKDVDALDQSRNEEDEKEKQHDNNDDCDDPSWNIGDKKARTKGETKGDESIPPLSLPTTTPSPETTDDRGSSGISIRKCEVEKDEPATEIISEPTEIIKRVPGPLDFLGSFGIQIRKSRAKEDEPIIEIMPKPNTEATKPIPGPLDFLGSFSIQIRKEVIKVESVPKTPKSTNTEAIERIPGPLDFLGSFGIQIRKSRAKGDEPIT